MRDRVRVGPVQILQHEKTSGGSGAGDDEQTQQTLAQHQHGIGQSGVASRWVLLSQPGARRPSAAR